MPNQSISHGETTPLLRAPPSAAVVHISQGHRRQKSSSTSASSTTLKSGDIISTTRRDIEDDVLLETAVLGRTLGWRSAYILIISRVIGSGIFATPGSIVSSVGSIGLSLTLWVAGAVLSWFGLAVGLEYGCMLPRSGGKSISAILNNRILTYTRPFCNLPQATRYTWNSLIVALDFWRRPL